MLLIFYVMQWLYYGSKWHSLDINYVETVHISMQPLDCYDNFIRYQYYNHTYICIWLVDTLRGIFIFDDIQPGHVYHTYNPCI